MEDINLGINDASIKYEVALEVLGQDLQPLMRAISLEKAKAKPSLAAIVYLEIRMRAIDELQQELRTDDLDTINQILDKSNRLFRVS